MLQAVRHPANYKPIIFCTISMVAIGIIMIVLGIVIVLIDYVEMGPPQYDEQYARYNGSNLAGIIANTHKATNEIGPMFIVFGSLLVLGNLCTLAYASRSYYNYLIDTANTSG